MMQLFVSNKVFVYNVSMKYRGEFHSALKMFAKEIGVPLYLIIDPSWEQTSAKVIKMCHDMGITLKILEESTHHANLSERYVASPRPQSERIYGNWMHLCYCGFYVLSAGCASPV